MCLADEVTEELIGVMAMAIAAVAAKGADGRDDDRSTQQQDHRRTP